MTMDARPEIERRHEDVYGDRSERYRSAIMALLDDGAFCGEDAAVLEGFRAYLGLDPTESEALFQEEARTPGPVLTPGVRITREYRGRRCDVEVLADGFLYEGQPNWPVSPWSG